MYYISEYSNFSVQHFLCNGDKEYLLTDAELKKFLLPIVSIGRKDDVAHTADKIRDRMHKIHPDLKSIILTNMGHTLINIASYVIVF